MHKIYHDPANPGGLGSVYKLHKAVRDSTGVAPAVSDVKHFLLGQDVFYTSCQSRHFPHNRVLVSDVDKQFQIDLVDMSEDSDENDGVKFLLMCIDVFSKYAWVRCLRNKSGINVTKAFNNILNEGRIPTKIQTDAGTEFIINTSNSYWIGMKSNIFQHQTKLKPVWRSVLTEPSRHECGGNYRL